MAPNQIQFGSKSNVKAYSQSKFGFIQQDSKIDSCECNNIGSQKWNQSQLIDSDTLSRFPQDTGINQLELIPVSRGNRIKA